MLLSVERSSTLNISIFRSIIGQYENLRAVNTVPMMNAISHSIEQQVIKHNLPVNFYAGFERFSKFPAQMRLYSRLGSAARRVYVFGVPDVKPTPISGVEYVAIEPNSPLAREWFLLVDTPYFWALLATEEVAGQDEATGGRKFDGIWSFDVAVVERASLLMSQLMGTVYQPVKQRNYDQQNMHIAEISAGMIAKLDNAHIEKRRSWAQANTLYFVIEALSKAQNSLGTLKEVADTLNSVFGASGVSILIHSRGDRFAIAAAEGETGATPGQLQAVNANTPSSRAATQGTSLLIGNMRKENEREPLMPTSQALLAIPLVGKQQVHGVLLIGHLDPNHWTISDQKVAESIGQLLSMWIETFSTESHTDSTVVSDENLSALRASVNQMITLHSVLRMEGSPNPRQAELIKQLDRLTMAMSQQVSVNRLTIQASG